MINLGVRLCTANGKTGYFHTWEHFSKPVEAGCLVGGAPAGIFSQIYGIVEFTDGVRRIDPTAIEFCDQPHSNLYIFNMEKEKNYDQD